MKTGKRSRCRLTARPEDRLLSGPARKPSRGPALRARSGPRRVQLCRRICASDRGVCEQRRSRRYFGSRRRTGPGQCRAQRAEEYRMHRGECLRFSAGTPQGGRPLRHDHPGSSGLRQEQGEPGSAPCADTRKSTTGPCGYCGRGHPYYMLLLASCQRGSSSPKCWPRRPRMPAAGLGCWSGGFRLPDHPDLVERFPKPCI